MTDPLTGLTNRRAFVAMLRHMVTTGQPGGLALLDIDHFKAINMKHGHSAGDEVLVHFAAFVRDLVRSSDIVSRVGGESLALLMPGASVEKAEARCRHILSELDGLCLEVGGERLCLTASAGVTRTAGTLDATLRRAEMALFLAKAKGRNRIECDFGLELAWDGSPAPVDFAAITCGQ